MMEAHSLGMHDEAGEHASNLAEWLNRGGFPPTMQVSTVGTKLFAVNDQLAREILRAACRVVLDQHEAGCDPLP